jgi:hypothetical protein
VDRGSTRAPQSSPRSSRCPIWIDADGQGVSLENLERCYEILGIRWLGTGNRLASPDQALA